MSENKEIFDQMFKDKVGQNAAAKDEIICIVDRSGSMGSIRKDAEGGLNEFVAEQKKVENGANITIIEFDTIVDTVCDQIDINEAVDYKLVPRGMTALLDAIGQVASDKDKYTTDGKTIVVVVTDGGENSSQEWNRDSIFELINERKEDGWEFVFLAANQDAIQTATHYGFDANATASFAATGDGVNAAYDMTSAYATTLRTASKSDALAAKKAYVDDHADVLSETGAVDDSDEVTS